MAPNVGHAHGDGIVFIDRLVNRPSDIVALIAARVEIRTPPPAGEMRDVIVRIAVSTVPIWSFPTKGIAIIAISLDLSLRPRTPRRRRIMKAAMTPKIIMSKY